MYAVFKAYFFKNIWVCLNYSQGNSSEGKKAVTTVNPPFQSEVVQALLNKQQLADIGTYLIFVTQKHNFVSQEIGNVEK